MAKPEARILSLEVVLLLGGLAMVGRAGYLQLIKGQAYAKRAAAQRTTRQILEAPRGAIYDRNGSVLATSLERYRIDIATEQVKNRDSLLRIYRTDVGAHVDRLAAALRAKDPFYAHGPFTAGQVRRLRTMRGVYLRPIYRREYPSGPLARPLIGALSPDSSRGTSGIERFLDSLLQGEPGFAVLLKDGRGRTYESPGRVARMPTRGADVVLTIDRELQEIAEGGLTQVFAESRPKRGDIVFLDARTGEVLAAASREMDATGKELASASYFQTSFEPGSTAKPLTAAALLQLRRVDSTDTVTGENGSWEVPGRPKPVTDDHPQKGPITLARAIQVSSNIAMGKFSQRLRPEEHFDMLRAFGLTSPTGVEFPGEASGTVPPPQRWKPGLEGVSAAMGYNIEVTPIQLAAAYAAIANDGILMAPSLIKEIRGPDGSVTYRHQPLVVRRVMSPEVAARLRAFLASAATDSGTGGRAQVKGTVLGKTGTARLVRNRRYTNEHAASFAGIYPARDPQLVVVARIEQPEGAYYGGSVAAPLVGRMLRQALAARKTALDRAKLAEDQIEIKKPQAGREAAREQGAAPATWTVFPIRPDPVGPLRATVVPDVVGEPARTAAAALQRRGFQVKLEGAGVVRKTMPEAGDSLGIGRTVTVIADGNRAG